jgi:hypothetical protein
MTSPKALAVLAIGALALGAPVTTPVLAAAPVAGIVGQHTSSVPACPNIIYRLARHDDGSITGMFWYSDLSGTSEAKGFIDKGGHFHTQLTSAIGNGPVGAVDGQRNPNGRVVADMKGEGCANFHSITMVPVPDVNNYGFSGGGA